MMIILITKKVLIMIIMISIWIERRIRALLEAMITITIGICDLKS